jgi:hypothetical protein
LKQFYTSRKHTQCSLNLFFVICLFLLGISIQAQDLPTDEPAPALETTVPASDVLPTEAPVLTPPPDIIPTQDATGAPSPVTGVPEITAEPTQQATLEPLPITLTAEVTEPASNPETISFPLLYQATFEGNDAAGLSSTEGWLEVAVEGGTALQAATCRVCCNPE